MFASLIPVLPGTDEDVRRKMRCSALVECDSVEANLCYLLSKRPMQVVLVEKARNKRWRVFLFSEKDKNDFITSGSYKKSKLGTQ